MGYSAQSLGQYTAWSPTFTGFSADPTAVTARYTLAGKMCHCYFSMTAGTSNATTFTMTLPFAAANTSVQINLIRITDNAIRAVGEIQTAVNSNVATIKASITSATLFTASGSKACVGTFTFEIA